MAKPIPAALSIVSRLLAALLGGYALTYAATAALAKALPVEPVDAVIIASLPAFALYTAVIIWAFAARSAIRLWASLGIATLTLALFAFWPRLLERLA